MSPNGNFATIDVRARALIEKIRHSTPETIDAGYRLTSLHDWEMVVADDLARIKRGTPTLMNMPASALEEVRSWIIVRKATIAAMVEAGL